MPLARELFATPVYAEARSLSCEENINIPASTASGSVTSIINQVIIINIVRTHIDTLRRAERGLPSCFYSLGELSVVVRSPFAGEDLVTILSYCRATFALYYGSFPQASSQSNVEAGIVHPSYRQSLHQYYGRFSWQVFNVRVPVCYCCVKSIFCTITRRIDPVGKRYLHLLLRL